MRQLFLTIPDLVALEDFATGAMENWGLITFRKDFLLTPKERDKIAEEIIEDVVAHELTHQVFTLKFSSSYIT
ncbi:unnamed protein product [Strongylus vulgaris]|uniref:Peptidase M1 membrane alanine aminopeptidase domain-containing protein n=1 Tax=Strongylus vulgaris TaxID=40348 RepID=A0A3P7JAS2_STRVU|nr:unnamed protein product [Strongylus vulgaris]